MPKNKISCFTDVIEFEVQDANNPTEKITLMVSPDRHGMTITAKDRTHRQIIIDVQDGIMSALLTNKDGEAKEGRGFPLDE